MNFKNKPGHPTTGGLQPKDPSLGVPDPSTHAPAAPTIDESKKSRKVKLPEAVSAMERPEGVEVGHPTVGGMTPKDPSLT